MNAEKKPTTQFNDYFYKNIYKSIIGGLPKFGILCILNILEVILFQWMGWITINVQGPFREIITFQHSASGVLAETTMFFTLLIPGVYITAAVIMLVLLPLIIILDVLERCLLKLSRRNKETDK